MKTFGEEILQDDGAQCNHVELVAYLVRSAIRYRSSLCLHLRH